MEQEILSIITNMSYSDKIKELYDNRSENIEFPPKLSITPNFKVLSDFCDEYFLKYEKVLLENAVIYALYVDEKNYLHHIFINRNQLRKCLEEDIFFRIKTSELAVKNIINKIIYNKNNDEEIKKEKKFLFDLIDSSYININPTTIVYRDIVLKFLNKTNEDEKEILLDNFLLTTRFDKYIKELSNGIIKENEINMFKNILIRLIMFDNYLHIESLLKDEELSNDIILKEDEYDEEQMELFDEDKEYEDTNDDIIEYIDNCIKNNNYILPNNIDLRYGMYSRFISYNLHLLSREDDFKLIKDDKKKVLNLKKINPLYKLEMYKIKNK